jgi:hypothetical protein
MKSATPSKRDAAKYETTTHRHAPRQLSHDMSPPRSISIDREASVLRCARGIVRLQQIGTRTPATCFMKARGACGLDFPNPLDPPIRQAQRPAATQKIAHSLLRLLSPFCGHSFVIRSRRKDAHRRVGDGRKEAQKAQNRPILFANLHPFFGPPFVVVRATALPKRLPAGQETRRRSIHRATLVIKGARTPLRLRLSCLSCVSWKAFSIPLSSS